MKLRSVDKPLNRMDRLGDMGHFPVAVHAGATANILLTLALTWWVEGRVTYIVLSSAVSAWQPGGDNTTALMGGLTRLQLWTLLPPLVWAVVVLVVNLSPVALLRLGLTPDTPYPPLGSMSFWTDQHKFSTWVYLAASANMAFWVLLGWVAFTWSHTLVSLAAMLLLAAVATFSPVLLRLVRSESA